jgi:hypothetical protein
MPSKICRRAGELHGASLELMRAEFVKLETFGAGEDFSKLLVVRMMKRAN